MIDEGLTLMFRGPASFTGEDVAEFHGHGGVIITNLLLETCLSFGARLANPGNFPNVLSSIISWTSPKPKGSLT